MAGRTCGSIARIVSGFALVAALGGCAITSPPQITRSAAPSQTIADFQWAVDEAPGELRARFASALTSEFAAEGITPKAKSRWVADYSIAVLPDGVSTVPVDDQEPASADALKTKPVSKWYHKCKADTVRGKLVVYDLTNNTIAASAEGEYVACAGDTGQLRPLAKELVTVVVGKTPASLLQE